MAGFNAKQSAVTLEFTWIWSDIAIERELIPIVYIHVAVYFKCAYLDASTFAFARKVTLQISSEWKNVNICNLNCLHVYVAAAFFKMKDSF